MEISTSDLILRLVGGNQSGELITVKTKKCLLGHGMQSGHESRPKYAIFRGPAGVAIRSYCSETLVNGENVSCGWIHAGDQIRTPHMTVEVQQVGEWKEDSKGCSEPFLADTTNETELQKTDHENCAEASKPNAIAPAPQHETDEPMTESQHSLDLNEQIDSIKRQLSNSQHQDNPDENNEILKSNEILADVVVGHESTQLIDDTLKTIQESVDSEQAPTEVRESIEAIVQPVEEPQIPTQETASTESSIEEFTQSVEETQFPVEEEAAPTEPQGSESFDDLFEALKSKMSSTDSESSIAESPVAESTLTETPVAESNTEESDENIPDAGDLSLLKAHGLLSNAEEVEPVVAPAEQEETESVSDLLERMKDSGQLDFDSADDANEHSTTDSLPFESEILLDDEQLPTPAVFGEVQGEEDVEDYMSQLFNRLRGPEAGAAAMALSQESSGKPAKPTKQAEPQPVSEEKAAPVEMLKESEFKPIAVAPERGRNMDAMRDLANENARNAVAASRSKREKAAVLAQLAIAGIGAMAAAVLFFLCKQVGDAYFIGAVGSGIASGGAGFRYLMTTVSKSKSKN